MIDLCALADHKQEKWLHAHDLASYISELCAKPG